MYLLAVILGLLAAWLDIFFAAAWPAELKISWLLVLFVLFYAKNQRPQALLLIASAALAADLMSSAGFFGARLLGYFAIYLLARVLSASFFTINRPGGAVILIFLLALAGKIGNGLFANFYYWWLGGGNAGSLTLGSGLAAVIASLATAAILGAALFVLARLDKLTNRFFLIRH